MTVVCDTSAVPIEDRAELWVAASSEPFVPLECRPHDRPAFHGLMQTGTVGPLALSRLDMSPHTVHRLAAAARAGNVWVNMPNPLDAAAPLGGVKSSGWGREMGKDAIDLYTEVKSVWVSLS